MTTKKKKTAGRVALVTAVGRLLAVMTVGAVALVLER